MSQVNYVKGYDSSLTLRVCTNLSTARYNLISGSVGNYAVFAGGTYANPSARQTGAVDAYDSSLTHSTPISISARAFGTRGRSTVNNYLIFPGSNKSDVFDSSLTHSYTSEGINYSTADLAAACNDDYAVFYQYACTQGYDKSLTKQIFDVITTPYVRYSSGASVGKYILFAGGYGSTTKQTSDTARWNTVNVYEMV